MKKITLFLLVFTVFAQIALAEITIFTSKNCPFCRELESYIDEQGFTSQLSIREISQNQENAALYIKISKELGYTNGMVPLLVDETTYIEGKQPIIDYLNEKLAPSDPATSSNAALSAQESKELNSILASDSSTITPDSLTKARTDYKTITIFIFTAFLLIASWKFFRKRT